jgi:hypothetical protein
MARSGGVAEIARFDACPGIAPGPCMPRCATEAATAPLARHLADQLHVLRFCLRAFDLNAVYPDGSEEPNPFDPDGGHGWRLTPAERSAAPAVVACSGWLQLVPLRIWLIRESSWIRNGPVTW